MKVQIGVLVCLLVTLEYTSQADIKIAIIGGGIGGTSCAWYLRDYFNDGISIDLYEGGKIGGRLATVALKDGVEYEAGGAVIHLRNLYMATFVNMTGLQRDDDGTGEQEHLCLYSNDGFKFISSFNYTFNIIKTWWRYGLDINKMNNFVEDVLNKFARIYDYQDACHSYDTVNDLLLAMDPAFVSYLNTSIKDAFLNLGISERIIEEIVNASVKMNYGQNVNVHQFVGAVSLAGTKGLWSVKGGNKQVAEKLLILSKARLIREYVERVTQRKHNNVTSYEITTKSGNALTYDYVVYAAPLAENQKNPIVFTDISPPVGTFGKYHRTVSTFVVGRLKREKFSPISNGGDAAILIALNENECFYCIESPECVAASSSNLRNWKVFSPERLTSDQLNELFESPSDVQYFDWLAYPEYETPSNKPLDFQLSDRLYHVNVIEWAASAMEMSCIGARNVALLIRKNIISEWNKTNQ